MGAEDDSTANRVGGKTARTEVIKAGQELRGEDKPNTDPMKVETTERQTGQKHDSGC